MSSWFQEDQQLSLLQRTACKVLKAGPIPRHIAFIMDGNRRFARKAKLASVLQGHAVGFEQLSKTLRWCRDFGITEVTVYAFSIENFKRQASEVEGLMNLARDKFRELLENRAKIAENGVCFRFFGNLSMLPKDVQRLLAEISVYSKNFDSAYFNVCLAYTSQDEMTRAVRNINECVEMGILEPEDITETLIDRCLDTRHSPDPDLLIRTSGELRMSDFLLWQCSHSCLCFEEVLWPEFNFWHLAYAIVHFQRNFTEIQRVKLEHTNNTQYSEADDGRIEKFLNFMEKRHLTQLEEMMSYE